MDFSKYPYLRNIGGVETEPDEELVPSGWTKRFFQMCDEINAALEEADYPKDILKVVQVKEKLGGMRFYYNLELPEPAELGDVLVQDAVAERISDIVDLACSETEMICVNCGAEARYCTVGWIIPFCKDCAEKSAEKSKEKNPDFKFDKAFIEIVKLSD